MLEKINAIISEYKQEFAELETADIEALVSEEIEKIKPTITERISNEIENKKNVVKGKIEATQKVYETYVYHIAEQSSNVEAEPTETTPNQSF